MVFHWSLSDSKSPQVSRTLLSILVILNNVVVRMVSTRLLISKSSSLFNNTLVTVPKALITIAIIITFMFHSFSNPPSKVEVLIFFFTFFQFHSSFFYIIRSGSLAEIRWSVCISKSHRSLCASFSRTDAELCIYHLFIWSNFWQNSQWITLPTQLCLVLYSFCANLQHSLIMWLMVSSLLPHNLLWRQID